MYKCINIYIIYLQHIYRYIKVKIKNDFLKRSYYKSIGLLTDTIIILHSKIIIGS